MFSNPYMDLSKFQLLQPPNMTAMEWKDYKAPTQPAEAPAGDVGSLLGGLTMEKVGQMALKNALPLAMAGKLVSTLGGAQNTPLTRGQDQILGAASELNKLMAMNKGYTGKTGYTPVSTEPAAGAPQQTRVKSLGTSLFDKYFGVK